MISNLLPSLASLCQSLLKRGGDSGEMPMVSGQRLQRLIRFAVCFSGSASLIPVQGCGPRFGRQSCWAVCVAWLFFVGQRHLIGPDDNGLHAGGELAKPEA